MLTTDDSLKTVNSKHSPQNFPETSKAGIKALLVTKINIKSQIKGRKTVKKQFYHSKLKLLSNGEPTWSGWINLLKLKD